MRFYLVRHGETLFNAEHIHQGEVGLLSPLGRLQAEKVGMTLAHHGITRILASTYPRARETAAIINATASCPHFVFSAAHRAAQSLLK